MMLDRKIIESYKDYSIKKLKIIVQNQFKSKEHKIITYSKNFTLPLSNYCQNRCGYCFFNHNVAKPKGKNVIILDKLEIESATDKALQYKCIEALLMSGEKPDSFEIVKDKLRRKNYLSFLDYVIDVSKFLIKKNLLPHINIGSLTYEELKKLKDYNASMGLMIESTSEKLLKKGQVHEFSRGKLPLERIKHIENAGKLKIPFTTGLLLGIGEDFEDRINDLFLINELHEKYSHIQEVIIQNFVHKPGILYYPPKKLSIEDMLRITGIARLILNNDVSIQVPPNLINGNEQDFIEMGIDDFGGISPFSIDYINPKKPWPQIEHLSRICTKNGYRLKERLPVYDKFIKKEGFIPENIKDIIKVKS